MKKIVTTSILLLVLLGSYGQSRSYQAMKDTFIGGEDVHAISVNGILCRMVLGWADENRFRQAITEVKSLKLILVPKAEFRAQGLTVSQFKKMLHKDSFEELAFFRDENELVSIFLQENERNKDRYFILVESTEKVMGIEIRGNVDLNALMSTGMEVAYCDY